MEKKLDATSANPSSSTCVVSFTQTNPHTSGSLAGDTSMPNPSFQSMNHFHSQTTIEGLAPTLGMPQQTMTSFSMPNPGLAPYTFGYNDQAYPNPNGNYQASYTIVAYTDHIPLSGSLLGFLPNHTYQNTPRFNTYGQPEADGFGFETTPQFPSRLPPIDMTPP
jgi:hypothetical protein